MADHYGSLAGASAYIATLANGAAWAGSSDEARTSALARASRSLDGVYGARFPGTKTGRRAQSLAWPRTGALDHCTGETIPANDVPAEIEHAAYALALAELRTPGATSPEVTPGRLVKRQKVEGLEREFFGAGDGAQTSAEAMRPVNMMVEDALRCLLVKASGGASVCVVRV